jgi:protein-L-isoaspartate(D-aspartate) O-methyltransferase
MPLLVDARRRLDALGYHVASKCGDGTIGWSEYAPFDGIIVTAGAPDVPRPLVEQLKDGGRLVIPIGDLDAQNLYIITKRGSSYETRIAEGFKFVPLIGKKGWR